MTAQKIKRKARQLGYSGCGIIPSVTFDEYKQYLDECNVLEMDDDIYANVIYPRFWYTGKDGLWQWKCNALRCMINSGDSKYHHLIKRCCNHTDARLRKIAKWGCN